MIPRVTKISWPRVIPYHVPRPPNPCHGLLIRAQVISIDARDPDTRLGIFGIFSGASLIAVDRFLEQSAQDQSLSVGKGTQLVTLTRRHGESRIRVRR